MNPSASQTASLAELVQCVVDTLNQGETLLHGLTDELYVRKLPVAFNASIGGHYRHCLDHFRSLLEAAPQGDLNYDRRTRGTPVETNRMTALQATRGLLERYQRLDPSVLRRPLTVICRTRYTGSASQVSSSTVGREIMYSVAHAVHHYALIGIMAKTMRVLLPAGFGVAPSTLEYQASARMAT